MTTLDIDQAAAMLHMNKVTLCRKAKLGLIPAKKPGRRWVFSATALEAYLSGAYDNAPRGLQTAPTEEKQCQSTSVVKRIGFSSQTQTETEYKNLLLLKTKKKPKK